jgi:hypothetical protein
MPSPPNRFCAGWYVLWRDHGNFDVILGGNGRSAKERIDHAHDIVKNSLIEVNGKFLAIAGGWANTENSYLTI